MVQNSRRRQKKTIFTEIDCFQLIFDHILKLESIGNGSKYKNKAKIVQKYGSMMVFVGFHHFLKLESTGNDPKYIGKKYRVL
jgi:hypothetical protein